MKEESRDAAGANIGASLACVTGLVTRFALLYRARPLKCSQWAADHALSARAN